MLYLAHIIRVGRGNLVLRHSVTQSPLNATEVSCGGTQCRFALAPDRRNENIKYLISSRIRFEPTTSRVYRYLRFEAASGTFTRDANLTFITQGIKAVTYIHKYYMYFWLKNFAISDTMKMNTLCKV